MIKSDFTPDYRNFSSVMRNQRPGRLPLYEHIISPTIMERILDKHFAALHDGNTADKAEFFRQFCGFFRAMTYDTVSYEVCIGEILPGPTALCGGVGPIQSQADFDAYPWDELPARFWSVATARLDALVDALPPGMKAIGGVGNGVFELAEALVGMEYLPYMQMDDPDLYHRLFQAIGDTMVAIWSDFMPRYGRHFVACRFGDDLGFKSSLLTNPVTVRQYILPQYRRLIDMVHGNGGLFLWHSCGCIFEIMEDVIALGIDAKHSNEDAVAPYERWITDYGDRIGLMGGFDMDFLCSADARTVHETVIERGSRYRAAARGYALGSGNSIPDYVPVDNYLSMVEAAQAIRQEEA
jgi:uroporphyrinogen decarboxylase